MSTNVHFPDPRGVDTICYSEIPTEVGVFDPQVNGATKIAGFESSSEASSPWRTTASVVSGPQLITADLKLNQKVKMHVHCWTYLARAVISCDFMASDRKLSSLHKVSYRNAIRI